VNWSRLEWTDDRSETSYGVVRERSGVDREPDSIGDHSDHGVKCTIDLSGLECIVNSVVDCKVDCGVDCGVTVMWTVM